MKIARLLLLIPGLFVVAILARAFDFAGFSTLREDSPKMLDAFWDVMDAAWAWFATPPLWATVLALVVMVAAYILTLVGGRNLLHVAKFIWKRDMRIAQLQHIADDKTVQSIQVSATALKIIETTGWEQVPLPDLPHATDASAYRVANAGDYMRAIIREDNPIRRVERVFDQLAEAPGAPLRPDVAEVLGRKKLTYLSHIKGAGENALANSHTWPDIEQGRVFMNETDRRHWHRVRAEIMEINRLLPELRGELEAVARRWKPSPNEAALTQLLQGIGEEKQP